MTTSTSCNGAAASGVLSDRARRAAPVDIRSAVGAGGRRRLGGAGKPGGNEHVLKVDGEPVAEAAVGGLAPACAVV